VHWIRRSLWLVALLPTAAALAFVVLASPHPEALADRAAGGWSATWWSVDAWLRLGDGECLPGQRALLALVMQVPGLDLRWAAALGIVLAIVSVMLVARAVARAVGDGFAVAPLAYLAVSAMCLSPTYGQDWLHVERAGVFVPPLLLVLALGLLDGRRAAAWRMLGAAVLAALAPTFHPTGALVGAALWPATYACAQRVDRRGLPWSAVVAAAGLSVAIAQWVVGGWHGAASGLQQVTGDPLAFAWLLLERLGGCWGDLLTDSRFDERAFGALSLAALVALPLLPRREGAGEAARWWTSAAFGASAVVLTTVWLPADAPGYARIALAYGSFLLPIGLVGVAATRFSLGMWSIALGAACVLQLQDWSRGAQFLRHGYARAAAVAAAAELPPGMDDEVVSSLRAYVDAEVRERLTKAGKVPAAAADLAVAVTAAAGHALDPDAGLVQGGSPIEVHGFAHVGLLREPVGTVFAVATVDAATALRGAKVVQNSGGLPVTPWRIAWSEALPEGAKLVVVGRRSNDGKLVVLGRGTVRDGKWTADAAGS
jgi:hypothetical protein